MSQNPKQEERLKEAIQMIHEREGGNYQQLISQAKPRLIEYNIPQVFAAYTPQQMRVLEWGRGTGKTTTLAGTVYRCVREMPRSTGLFIVPNYQFALSHIIGSLVKGLEMYGLYQNLHYFISEKPPRKWRKSWGRAYEPPQDYKHYVTFWNGTGMHLISHDVPSAGRGLNSDWIIGDEAALLDPAKLQENTDPTRRGTNQFVFGNCPLLGLRMYVSSTPITPQGRWMFKLEDQARQQPDKIMYHRATCQYNLHNLRPGYLEDAKAIAYNSWVFNAEYMGIRPRFTKDSFYPLFDSDKHCYREKTVDGEQYHLLTETTNCRGDLDLTRGVPLILGMDWGASINCLTVNQYLRSINEYRTLKDMFVLGEDQKIQDDLFKEFHEYYEPHQGSCKIIHLWYDNTGNLKTGNTRQTRAQQAKTQLEGLGWQVELKTLGLVNPRHEAKYNLWTQVHREDNPRLPRYRVNFYRTRNLQASMANAQTKEGRNGEIKKDKSIEKKKGIDRQHATDLSDANDAPMYGMFGHLMYSDGMALPGPRASGR
ncbi:MAG: hypothetical protein AAF840_01750 [Bacteroidota bacterium]